MGTRKKDNTTLAQIFCSLMCGGQFALLFVHCAWVGLMDAFLGEEISIQVESMFFPSDHIVAQTINAIQFCIRFLIFTAVIVSASALAILLPLIALFVCLGYFALLSPDKKDGGIPKYLNENPLVLVFWLVGLGVGWCIFYQIQTLTGTHDIQPGVFVIAIALLTAGGIYQLTEKMKKKNRVMNSQREQNALAIVEKNRSFLGQKPQESIGIRVLYLINHFLIGTACAAFLYIAFLCLFDTIAKPIYNSLVLDQEFVMWTYLKYGARAVRK